jgi:hypothetical protein
MTAWIFLRNILFVVACMIGGGALLAFLAASVTEWLLPRPRRGPAGWPILAGIVGTFFGLVGGGFFAGYCLERIRSR